MMSTTKKLVSLFREEDGAAEMLQVIIILGLVAMIGSFLVAISLTIEPWGKDRVTVILHDEAPEDVAGGFIPPEWTRPGNFVYGSYPANSQDNNDFDEIKFRFNSKEEYRTVPADGLVVLEGSEVDFKVTQSDNPSSKPQPQWGLESGDICSPIGKGETVTVTFKDASTSLDDYSKVIATSDDTSIEVNVLVVKVELEKVSFKDGHVITRDDGRASYSAPHWDRGRISNPLDYFISYPLAYPIAYTSGKEIRLDVEFKSFPAVELKIRGKFGKEKFYEQTVTAKSGSIKIANISCWKTEKKVDYVLLGLDWEASLNAGADWQSVGRNENQLYVTLKDPTTTGYETMYELACKHAGAANEKDCIANTWASFRNRDVKAMTMELDSVFSVFDRKLYYYKTDYGDGKTSVELMLQNPNDQGQCGAWADLFHKTLAIHGIKSNIVQVDPPDGYDMFGVKNTVLRDDEGNIVLENGRPDITVKGIPGQNMDTPRAKLFNLHYIVKTSDGYYDPSYGVTAKNEAEYTEMAVDVLSQDGWNWEKREKIPSKTELIFDVFR